MNRHATIRHAADGENVESILFALKSGYEETLEAHRERIEGKREEVRLLASTLPKCAQAPGGSPDYRAGSADIAVRVNDTAYAWRRSQAELRGFAQLHGLIPEPQTPNRLEATLQLAALTILEAAGGAIFLGSAHMTASPIQALLVSLMVAATNMSLCVAAGYFAGRYLSYGRYADE